MPLPPSTVRIWIYISKGIMKERPLNFDYTDETPVEVTDEQKAKLNKYANELKQHIGMLLYLIDKGSLQVGTRDSIMTIINHNMQDLCNLFDYSTYFKQQQEKTQREIREVNIENHELRRQLGQKVSTEDVRMKMKAVIDGFRYWSETKGFGRMSDIEVDHWGTLSGRMRTSICHTNRNDKEIRKRMSEFGFVFEDVNEDGAEPIANDHNLQKIRELVKTLSPDAIADKVTVCRRGDVPHIEDVTIILREWDCLDPYIKANIEEEQRRYGTKK